MEDVTNRVMTAALGNPNNGDITKLNNPVTVTINNQRFTIDLKQTDFIKSKMTDTDGNAANGADYDNVYFEKMAILFMVMFLKLSKEAMLMPLIQPNLAR